MIKPQQISQNLEFNRYKMVIQSKAHEKFEICKGLEMTRFWMLSRPIAEGSLLTGQPGELNNHAIGVNFYYRV